MSTRVSGFTIVRNAQILGYPFLESVRSVIPLCDEFIINCGDSQDGTKELCENLASEFKNKIRIFESMWQTENQSSGLQLKYQTDQALSHCSGDWVFYIQADEVLDDNTVPAIRNALALANKDEKIDGLLFDYVHFYGSYAYEVRGRGWYRNEVRLFKNHRNIEAFRDAQGFRKKNKRLNVIRSGGKIFHYGYVRDALSMQKKHQAMSVWWGEPIKTEPNFFEPKHPVGLRVYKGKHPTVMREKILSSRYDFDPRNFPRIWNLRELRSALSLMIEKRCGVRLGEFRNYTLLRSE